MNRIFYFLTIKDGFWMNSRLGILKIMDSKWVGELIYVGVYEWVTTSWSCPRPGALCFQSSSVLNNHCCPSGEKVSHLLFFRLSWLNCPGIVRLRVNPSDIALHLLHLKRYGLMQLASPVRSSSSSLFYRRFETFLRSSFSSSNERDQSRVPSPLPSLKKKKSAFTLRELTADLLKKKVSPS